MISKNELIFAALLSAVVVLISTVPFYYAHLTAPADKVFMGDVSGHFDFNTYLTWMEQGKLGHALFKDKYTTEQNPRTLFHPLFLFLGLVSRLTGLPLRAVAEAAREMLGLLLLFSFYPFISLFFRDIRLRILTFCLLLFSSGFGWMMFAAPLIASLTGSWVMLGTININMFNLIFAPAVYSFSCLLLVMGFYFFLLGVSEGKNLFFKLSGAFLSLLVLTHPFDAQIFFSVIVLFFLANWLFAGRAPVSQLLPIAITLPVIFLQALAAFANPIFKEHAVGGAATVSSNLIFYIGGLGLTFFFALAGIMEILSGKASIDRTVKQRQLFIMIWVAAVPALLYLPTTFQGRAPLGIQLPITILAALGIEALIKRFSLNAVVAWAAIFLLTLPTNAMLLKHCIINLNNSKHIEKGIAPFLDRGIYDAMVWLSKNTKEDEVVFSDWNIGNYIPSVSGNTVFVGHWPQTTDFYNKQALVEQFFGIGLNDAQRKQILSYATADYVFFSFKEAAFGSFNPDQADYLQLVYNNEGVKIYKVSGII
jgi:hypothetical protein